jgi:hypothetical protein
MFLLVPLVHSEYERQVNPQNRFVEILSYQCSSGRCSCKKGPNTQSIDDGKDGQRAFWVHNFLEGLNKVILRRTDGRRNLKV